MKITGITTDIISLPFDHGGPPVGWGGRAWTRLDTLLVRVDTDDGLSGYGEAFGYNAIPATKAALETMIAPLLLGRDASDIEQLTIELQRTLHLFGRYGVTMFALSGLDIALWDLAGKRADLPLHRLLGAAQRDEIPAYASLFRYADPALAVERAGDAIEEGYPQIKLHETDPAIVEAVRGAHGDELPLMLNVNCAWSIAQAFEAADRLIPCNLLWLEEPLWPPEDYKALARLRYSGGIPTAAGENACTSIEFERMLEIGAVAYAQPSVTKLGGITEFRAATLVAREHNCLIAPHSPYFGPGLLATLQLLAASPQDAHVERFFCALEADLYDGALDPVDGLIRVPDGPGLGLDPDPDIIEAYRATEEPLQ